MPAVRFPMADLGLQRKASAPERRNVGGELHPAHSISLPDRRFVRDETPGLASAAQSAYHSSADEIRRPRLRYRPPRFNRMKTAKEVDRRERVLLLGVALRGRLKGAPGGPTAASRDSLIELEELAESAGANIVGSLLQVRDALDPAALRPGDGRQGRASHQ